jgi:uncharacterized membrane protein YtjA (UPF0391 family)
VIKRRSRNHASLGALAHFSYMGSELRADRTDGCARSGERVRTVSRRQVELTPHDRVPNFGIDMALALHRSDAISLVIAMFSGQLHSSFALLAAIFGFTGLAASAAGIAKIIFVVALILAVISLVAGRRPAV